MCKTSRRIVATTSNNFSTPYYLFDNKICLMNINIKIKENWRDSIQIFGLLQTKGMNKIHPIILSVSLSYDQSNGSKPLDWKWPTNPCNPNC